MKYNGKEYWTREELIEAFDADGFNERNKIGGFGLALFIPDLYDGLIYAEENFSKDVMSSLTMQTFSPD